MLLELLAIGQRTNVNFEHCDTMMEIGCKSVLAISGSHQ